MNVIKSSCGCGAVVINVGLSQSLTDCQPRQCDCDFCTERAIQYLSDVYGFITITAEQPLITLTQGSEQAQFLQCAQCQNVVAVSYQDQQRMVGAVNIALFTERNLMQRPMLVSPKQFSPSEKLVRWQQLWMPLQVCIGTEIRT